MTFLIRRFFSGIFNCQLLGISLTEYIKNDSLRGQSAEINGRTERIERKLMKEQRIE
jgi:hypothetical protein